MANEQTPRALDVARETGQLDNPSLSGPWMGVVESYDAESARATVRLTPQLRDYRSGTVYASQSPVTVPVAWGRMGPGVDDSRLEPGDEVLLVQVTPSIREWLTAGGLRPGTGPGRSVANSVAFPVGVSAARRASPPAPAGAMRRGRPDGAATVLIFVGDEAAAQRIALQCGTVVLGAEGSTKLPLARDGDGVAQSAAFTTWQQAVTLATGVPALPPVADIGTVSASSTDVVSG